MTISKVVTKSSDSSFDHYRYVRIASLSLHHILRWGEFALQSHLIEHIPFLKAR